MAKELKNPNKKQPIKFTTKILATCNRNKAPGIAPIDIKKKVFLLISIYKSPNINPSTKKEIPKNKETINNLKALKNFNCRHNSNRSLTNEEKLLKLPKKPIEKNKTS